LFLTDLRGSSPDTSNAHSGFGVASSHAESVSCARRAARIAAKGTIVTDVNESGEGAGDGARRWSGSCHCGDVRFEVLGEMDEVLDCNCTVCTKKGFLHWIVPPARFRLISGEPRVYSFGTHTAKHTFCGRCGMHPFYTPRSHPDHVDVNVRCLDGVDVRAISVVPFEGREDWERSRAVLALSEQAPKNR
jgi:hypothetical protein